MGNSNYCFIVPRNEFQLDRHAQMMTKALHQLDIPARVSPRHDICIGEQKVSGSAYRLIPQRALHHGTMLMDVDLALLREALNTDSTTVPLSLILSLCN